MKNILLGIIAVGVLATALFTYQTLEKVDAIEKDIGTMRLFGFPIKKWTTL